MDELIRIDGVHVSYAGKKVLDGIDLTIEPGEFVSIAGQTGCGKSTLLRLILGAERPTTGRVFIDGKEHYHPDRDRGYVPQKYSLFPDKTVLENIAFGPEMEQLRPFGFLLPSQRRRRTAIRQDAMRYLRSMGLQDADADKYPDELSGGMQQRVAIAQALIMHPKILLMDEACSALDPGTRAEIQKLLRNLWNQTGITVLFITHNIAEAVFLSSRVVVLGKEPGRDGARVALNLPIDEQCRLQSGYPRPEELSRLMRQIEDAAMGGRVELEMAEFGG